LSSVTQAAVPLPSGKSPNKNQSSNHFKNKKQQ